jgi:peptide/nickel transport system substrate-binding protein
MKSSRIDSVILVLALLFVLSLLTVCTKSLGAVELKPQYGGTLRIGETFEGISVGYPPKILMMTGYREAAPAIETLFRVDKTGKVVPWLATGSTDDVAAKTITLTLRRGIKFHDGTDFNAEAVKWNLDQCMAAKTAGTGKFKSVDVIDNDTVRIYLTQWDSTTTTHLAQAVGMMISPTAYKKNGEQWCANHPVGTGPFEFVSWEKDVRMVHKKFGGYWQKGKPYLDRIEFSPISDSLTRLISLKKGELDLMMTQSAKDIAPLEKEGYVVSRQLQGSGTYGIIPDSSNPKSPWADVRVRQAAQHAIDTEAIVKTIFYGEAEAANQWIYKGHWGHNPNVTGYPYNPTKAKQLLAEAGYPNGFKTKLLYRTTPEYDQLTAAIQAYLKVVGIDIELDPGQTARYNQIAYSGGRWEGLIWNTVSSNPDVTAALVDRYAGDGRNYSLMLVPDDYAKAIQNAVAASDFEAKQRWTKEAMKLMIDKYCLQILLYCRKDLAVSPRSLHNHGYCATPNTASWSPEEAWLER